MNVFQAFGRYGDEFAFVVGCSRRFGVPLHHTRPQHVGLAVAHAVDGLFQFLVRGYGYLLGKVFVGLYVVHSPRIAILRALSLLHKVGQNTPLYLFAMVGVRSDVGLSAFESSAH